MFDQIPLILAQDAETPPLAKDKAVAKDAPTAKDAPATKDSATTGTPGAPIGPGGQPRTPSFFDNSFIFILMGGLLLMIIFSMRTQRKEKKKREALMTGLKKGDRIQTIGGLLASVVEVKDDRVIVKADENNNTKLTFVRSAIQAVISDKTAEKPEPEVKKD